MAWTEAQIADLKRLGHRPIGGSVGQVKWHWINNGRNNLMKTLVLRLPGPPLLVMTLVAVVCSIAVADAADSTKIGTSTDGDAGRHSETDQGTGALKTDDLFIDWDIINWDWKKDTDQIAKVGLSGSQIAQAAQEEDESAALNHVSGGLDHGCISQLRVWGYVCDLRAQLRG